MCPFTGKGIQAKAACFGYNARQAQSNLKRKSKQKELYSNLTTPQKPRSNGKKSKRKGKVWHHLKISQPEFSYIVLFEKYIENNLTLPYSRPQCNI